MSIRIAIIIIALGLSGCDAPNYNAVRSNGKAHRVTLYSGGQKVQEWITTEDPTMAGCRWFFTDNSGRSLAISGDVTVEVQQ